MWNCLAVLAAGHLCGQQVALSLSSASAALGSSVALTVSMSASGGAQPAGIQWTLTYPAALSNVSVTPGPATTNAGKTISCGYGSSSVTCLVWGINTTVISDGPVALVSFQISTANPSGSVAVTNQGGIAVDFLGNMVPTFTAGGMIALLPPPSIGCAPTKGPGLLGQFYSAQCTATGGVPPYNWQVVSGALPPGITLASQGASALISGIPSVAGVYNYTISASDSSSPLVGKATLAYAVTIQSGSPGYNLIGSMPHLAAEENWTTTFTLVNTGAGFAQTRLSLLGDDGNSLPLPLTLPQQPATQSAVTTPSVDWTLAPNASLLVQTAGPASAPVQVGSAQLTATGSMGGFAIFHLIPNDQEAVVPLETRNASSYLLPFDNTNGVVLGVALANIVGQAVEVAVTVRDDAGVPIASGSIPLPGNGHVSFGLSDRFPVTANQRGTIEFATPLPGQISTLGMRYTPPGTLTTIPALANAGSGGGSMTHIALANGWKTTFVLVNTGNSAAQAHLAFFDDNGNPLILPLSFPQTGGGVSEMSPAIDRTLAAGATLLIDSTGPDEIPVKTGSAQLTADGNIGGFEIFRYEPSGQEAVVPLEDRNAGSYILPFDNTAGTATGVAVSTISAEATNVTVVICDDTGARIGEGVIPLAANGHLAFVLATQFPVTAGTRGTVEFLTPPGTKISVLGLRTPLAHTFTTLPTLTR